jgi:ABC-2 type transport system ATP-binding protein
VKDVDLTVTRGDVYGLLGPNGAGKTTFMRMLFGLIRPDEGRLEVFGRSIEHQGVAALAGVAGFVETPRFYPYLSGRANLEILSTLDRGEGRTAVQDALRIVELADRAGSKVREYSYGMVQRLGVAASLMRDPQLLVLDEPTNGLDPAGIRDMRALIARLAGSGITVLLSSHNMLEVQEVCQQVAIMHRGELAFDGSLRELRERAREAEYQLRTDDDERALEVCRRIEGIRDARLASRAITFDARERHVELLSRALGASGIGIRSLVAPTSALETVFFRLTDHAEDGHLDAVREPVVGAGTQESVS